MRAPHHTLLPECPWSRSGSHSRRWITVFLTKHLGGCARPQVQEVLVARLAIVGRSEHSLYLLLSQTVLTDRICVERDRASWLMGTSRYPNRYCTAGALGPLSTGRRTYQDTGIRAWAMSWSWMGCLLGCAPRRCVSLRNNRPCRHGV
jgi:hypothetical protein